MNKIIVCFFFSSRMRLTRCALMNGVQTCALPISPGQSATATAMPPAIPAWRWRDRWPGASPWRPARPTARPTCGPSRRRLWPNSRRRCVPPAEAVGIRGYRPDDRDALYAVVLATGHEGGDAAALYRDPRLLGHVYAGPYAALHPELVLVADDAARKGCGEGKGVAGQ